MIPVSTFLVVTGLLSLLAFYGSVTDNIYEDKQGKVTGLWPGAIFVLVGFLGCIAIAFAFGITVVELLHVGDK